MLLKGGRVTEQRRIVVVFKEDKLDRIEGDVTAMADPALPTPAKPAK